MKGEIDLGRQCRVNICTCVPLDLVLVFLVHSIPLPSWLFLVM